MKKIILLIVSLISINLSAQMISGEEVLRNIDRNLSSKNKVVKSKMIIHGRRGSRTIESRSWIEGEEKSFTEYLSPPRERGTKMLKLKDRLWIYSPSTDRVILISGHMLRQSVMGSDLSYEDMMEDPRLSNNYHAEVTGIDTVDGRSCWLLELEAKNRNVSYHFRKLWVDRERSIPLREELYAKSGKLLKKVELKQIVWIENRWYPKRMTFKDMLKIGKGTEFVIESIKFDVDIPQYIFSKASLKK